MRAVHDASPHFRLHHMEIVLDALVHVLILFGFLTCFYAFFASGMEKHALESEVGHMIDENIQKTLREADAHNSGALKALLGNDVVQTSLGTLEKLYEGDDPAVATYNRWLFSMAGVVTLSLLLIVIVLVTTLYGTCQLTTKNVGFAGIVRENLWIFAVVGVVEYLFFSNVAFKWLPAPPSGMLSALLKSIHKSFDGEGDSRADSSRPAPHTSRGGSRDKKSDSACASATCSDVWPCVTPTTTRTTAIIVGVLMCVAVGGVVWLGKLKKVWAFEEAM